MGLRIAVPTLDAVPPPIAAVSMGSQLVNNVADPAATTDAANKEYVDGAANAALSVMNGLGTSILVDSALFRPWQCSGTRAMASGFPYYLPIYVPKTTTLTGVKWLPTTTGAYTANNNTKIGLYSYSAGTLTLVASCANDGTIFKATANTLASKAFSSTYSAAAGLYFIAWLVNWSAVSNAPANMCYAVASGSQTAQWSLDLANSSKMWMFLSAGGATDLASTVAASACTTDNSGAYWSACY